MKIIINSVLLALFLFSGSIHAETVMPPRDVNNQEEPNAALADLQKRAEQGDVDAQKSLGINYEIGWGVPKDEAQAVFWYRKAAEQGDVFAQFELGLLYMNGTVIPKDNEIAYLWFLLSSAQGSEAAAKLRDLVEKSLTFQQRANAQAVASAWKPKKN